MEYKTTFSTQNRGFAIQNMQLSGSSPRTSIDRAGAMNAPFLPAGVPTGEAYAEILVGFDHFNADLFDATLPPVLVTFQRKKRCHGYLSADRFVHRGNGSHAHEIALNPAYFALETVVETMQTLVHEQVHLWQRVYGTPGRRGYHNREWADKMESLGLMPSSTGRPGGARTGEHMSDYPIEGGLFLQSCHRLIATGFRISWLDRQAARARVANQVPAQVIASALPEQSAEVPHASESTVLDLIGEPSRAKKYQRKYRCDLHNVNLWGKPGVRVLCGECEKPLAELTE